MSMPARVREHLAVEVRGRAGAERGVVELAGIGLGVGDELGARC